MRRGMRGGRNVRNDTMPAMREDIQDLDRELELLRRKRQLIEEQQRQFQPSQYQQPQTFSRGHTISPWEQQPQLRSNDFNQPRTSYQNDFSNLYSSGQSNSGNGFDSGPKNRKRQFNSPRWQDESAGPKRFRDNRSNTGGNFNPPKKFAPRPKPFQGVGGSQASGPPQNKPAPKPFNKKKPFTKPNEKPAAAGRPTKPLPSAAPADSSNKKVEDKRVFLDYVIKDEDHRQYPKKVQGRIQFATGIIYKNLIGRFEKGSQAHTLYRHIKPILYARIYKAMVNKAVGNVQNIIEQYDAAFPSTTDNELVEQAAAKEAERLASIQPSLDIPESPNVDSRKTAGPKDYFRNNITDIMQKKLDEMIKKLKQTYENEYNLQETAQDGENVDADKTTGDSDASAAAASADTETVPKSNNDEETKSADAENAVTDEEKAATETSENVDGDNATLEESQNAEGDNATTEEPKTDGGDDSKDAKNVKNVGSKFRKNFSRFTKRIDNYHVTQVDDLVKREMWRLLTKIKDDLVTIMNMDKEFVNAKLTIAENADKMRLNLMKTPLHYVVLAGIPRLPKKAKLKTFLRHFHPNAIKKHRTVRNVLFIGFADPQDQANILKANNTIFENAKLSIKETKNIGNAADNQEKTEDNDITEEEFKELQTDGAEDSFQTEGEQVKEPKENSDKVIDSDLDGEINDLLASINNSETNPDTASGDVEMVDNDENDVVNDGEEAEGGDDGENQDGNEEQVIDAQEGEGNGDAVAVEDANGEAKTAEENKDNKTEATGVKGAVKKTAVATPRKGPARVAAGAVQTRRSSRLPN